MIEEQLEKYVYELECEKKDLLQKIAELKIDIADKDVLIRKLLIEIAKKESR